MYIDVNKVKEDTNDVVYEFFTQSSVSNGTFVLHKNKMDPFTFDISCQLIKPIDCYAPDAHYKRVMVAVMKNYNKNGELPEKAFFMSG